MKKKGNVIVFFSIVIAMLLVIITVSNLTSEKISNFHRFADSFTNVTDIFKNKITGYAIRDYGNNSSGILKISEVTCIDNDGDGYGNPESSDCTYSGLDCNDNDANIHPNAKELCNNIDDDCDGAIDEAIIGNVKSAEDGSNIDGALVTITGIASTYTDSNGNYKVCVGPAGTYQITIAAPEYETLTTNVSFDGVTNTIKDVQLSYHGTLCQPDCSFITDSVPVCHAKCDGINGCSYFDTKAKSVCTSPYEGWNKPVGSLVDYNNTYQLICCEGDPRKYILNDSQLFFNTKTTATITRTTRVVFWRGRIVRMIVDVFE